MEVLAGFSPKLIASIFTSRYLPNELGWMKEWGNNDSTVEEDFL